jgi:hypothetical protein
MELVAQLANFALILPRAVAPRPNLGTRKLISACSLMGICVSNDNASQ